MNSPGTITAESPLSVALGRGDVPVGAGTVDDGEGATVDSTPVGAPED
jgi:hypothetical protein